MGPTFLKHLVLTVAVVLFFEVLAWSVLCPALARPDDLSVDAVGLCLLIFAARCSHWKCQCRLCAGKTEVGQDFNTDDFITSLENMSKHVCSMSADSCLPYKCMTPQKLPGKAVEQSDPEMYFDRCK